MEDFRCFRCRGTTVDTSNGGPRVWSCPTHGPQVWLTVRELPNDFFEEDEAPEKIEAIWNRPGRKGRTVTRHPDDLLPQAQARRP